MNLPDWAPWVATPVLALTHLLAIFREPPELFLWVAPVIRFVKGSKMPNLMTLVPLAIKFVTVAYQAEQIEADPTKDAPTKRSEVLALLPQIESLVDAGAGLPAGAVEKYLTPAALELIYDGALLAEQKLAAG